MDNTPNEEERPASWLTIAPQTPVLASDGQEVGTVAEVLGWDQEDIFHGIVIHTATPSDARLITAEHVRTITNHQIETDLSSEQVRAIEPYVPNEAENRPPNTMDRYLDAQESE